MTTLQVNLGGRSYPVRIGRGSLAAVGTFFDLDRRVLVVTDSGVPKKYAEAVLPACKAPTLVTIPAGEASKNEENFLRLLHAMLDAGFERTDCVLALGGGVVGDLAGFAASCYMRGIDFYNIPTTLLSQVDSSVGGKTAIDFGGVKNIVGSFWQPKGVLIDPDTLSTLPARQISAGMAEIIKMAATFDRDLFERMESYRTGDGIEPIIAGALRIKIRVVEEDERESGLRRVLNFGHTLGHGIESERAGSLLHGECVALGMLPMSSDRVRARLIPLLAKFGLPTRYEGNIDEAIRAVAHDKKASGGEVTAVWCDEIGAYRIGKVGIEELRDRLARLTGTEGTER